MLITTFPTLIFLQPRICKTMSKTCWLRSWVLPPSWQWDVSGSMEVLFGCCSYRTCFFYLSNLSQSFVKKTTFCESHMDFFLILFDIIIYYIRVVDSMLVVWILKIMYFVLYKFFVYQHVGSCQHIPTYHIDKHITYTCTCQACQLYTVILPSLSVACHYSPQVIFVGSGFHKRTKTFQPSFESPKKPSGILKNGWKNNIQLDFLRTWSSAVFIITPGRVLWREARRNRRGNASTWRARPIHVLWFECLARCLFWTLWNWHFKFGTFEIWDNSVRKKTPWLVKNKTIL